MRNLLLLSRHRIADYASNFKFCFVLYFIIIEENHPRRAGWVSNGYFVPMVKIPSANSWRSVKVRFTTPFRSYHFYNKGSIQFLTCCFSYRYEPEQNFRINIYSINTGRLLLCFCNKIWPTLLNSKHNNIKWR